MANESKPEVAVVMGSASDWETMKRACDILDQFGVAYHKQVISVPPTPACSPCRCSPPSSPNWPTSLRITVTN